jgi:hypothetical protein
LPAALVIGGLCVPAAAQDPLVVAPHAYKLTFENEWVRVMRVSYAPHEKLPLHDHTQYAAAYVYLNDGGPVVFSHDYGAVTRPPTKAGSFRLYRAIREVHTVENPNDTPSEFLRVEWKTEPVNERSLRGKFHREEVPSGESLEKVQFENEQLRATRLAVAPGRTLHVSGNAELPALVVALVAGEAHALTSSGAPLVLKLAAGDVRWLPTGHGALGVLNPGEAPLELLRFDLKTKPLPTP